jgi:hypothetical protein
MKKLVVFSILLFAVHLLHAQNYTTLADGSWTTAANWNNTSGWGNATPSLTGGHGSGTATVNHNMSVTGNYSLGSATLLINAGKTVTVTGNFTVGGGSTVNIYGTLVIDGVTNLNSNVNIFPGGQLIVNGNLIVNSSNYLNVGTSTAPPPYGDLIVYQNLILAGSGDATINRNGRLAIFGNVTGAGGGTLFTVNNGGQVYVHGNMTLTGGGSVIANNNATNPFGLYVNGTVSNTGGGSSTTPNKADEVVMEATNPDFYDWVQNIPSSPLPIELVYFTGKIVNGIVELQWATASELNFDRFLIEHSTNGNDFTTISEQKGSGINSYQILKYSFKHDTPFFGRNYYRLKAVDQDGEFEYSYVILIQSSNSKQIKLFPNPANNYVNIELNFEPAEEDHLVIISPVGATIASIPMNFYNTKITFDKRLEPGIYQVCYKGSIHQTLRLLIQ